VPSWNDLSGMFKEGVRLVIVMYAYSLPLTIIFYVISGTNPLALNTSIEAQQQVLATMLSNLPIILAVILPLYLLLYYLLPVILFRVMETKNLSGGFDFTTIFRKAFNIKYLTAWLMAILLLIGIAFVFFILFIISGLLSIVLIGIPLLITLIPMFYYILGMVWVGILGQAYGEVK